VTDAERILRAYGTCGALAAMVLARHLFAGTEAQIDTATALGVGDRAVRRAVDALAAAGFVRVARGVIVGATGSHDPESGSSDPETGSYDPDRVVAEVPTGSYDPETGSHDPESGSLDPVPASAQPVPLPIRPRKRSPRTSVRVGTRAGSHAHEHARAGEVGDQLNAAISDELQGVANNAATAPAVAVPPKGGTIGGDLEPERARARIRTRGRPREAATLALDRFHAEYVRRVGSRPTVDAARVSLLKRRCKGMDRELAELAVDAFFADPWVTERRWGLNLLVSASVWDRCVATALERSPWLRPAPDPDRCEAATCEAWLSSLPAWVAGELAIAASEYEDRTGRPPSVRQRVRKAQGLLTQYRERRQSGQSG
jgi:hypothetical protein